jgi:hypothetical protein
MWNAEDSTESQWFCGSNVSSQRIWHRAVGGKTCRHRRLEPRFAGLSCEQLKLFGAKYVQNGLSPNRQEVGEIRGMFGTAG